MTFKMPYGYETTVLTEEQLKTKRTFNRLHPEVQRRFLALSKFLHSEGVPLGVGTGWRIQPSNSDGSALPGFAAPGNSWHEGVPVSSERNALAIDTVPATSWDRMEEVCGQFGFRTFRHLGEPWHIQPIEIPASRNFATTLPHIKKWKLPEDESDMAKANVIVVQFEGADDQFVCSPMDGETKRRLGLRGVTPIMASAHVSLEKLEEEAGYKLTRSR